MRLRCSFKLAEGRFVENACLPKIIASGTNVSSCPMGQRRRGCSGHSATGGCLLQDAPPQGMSMN